MSEFFDVRAPHVVTKTGEKILYPFGPPIFQTQVDPNFTKELIEEGRKLTIEEDDYNPRLAGNLKYGNSYHYKDSYLNKVEPYLKSYVERFFNGLYEQWGSDYPGVNNLLSLHRGRQDIKKGNLVLDSLWINFQQKHDFNPPHHHNGVLSFVVFCKVPKEIFKDQVNCNHQQSGHIVFQNGEKITNLMGTEFPCIPTEDLMFIFPNELKHYVPGYWVDAERISVSGNFVVV